MAKESGVLKGTGRERAEWFELLDRWGAPGRPFPEISDWLRIKHGLSKWWAQKIIVEYEQDRGIREPGVRRNGTFEVGTSKTVEVPVDQLFEAFVDARKRNGWLKDGAMSLRDFRPSRSARFDWGQDGTRVSVLFSVKGPSKTVVSVSHEKLKDASAAESTKESWKERLGGLKERLERESAAH